MPPTPPRRSLLPSTPVSAPEIFWAGVGAVALLVQLPIVKMILDDPHVLSLAGWDWTVFLFFFAVTFVGLPATVGLLCWALFRRHARLGQFGLLAVTCYLFVMQIYFHEVLFRYPTASWRQAVGLGLFLALLGGMWRFRRWAIETLKVCRVFGAGILIVFAFHAAPVRLAGSAPVPAMTSAGTAKAGASPVFFLTFEKLAASFVLNAGGEVPADRFPNLAQFVAGADLYPNAYADMTRTTYALKTLYAGRVLTGQTDWQRHPTLRDILGADRQAVMVLDAAMVDYCRPPGDACVRRLSSGGSAALDLVAGWYKTYAYMIAPGRLQRLFGLLGWRYDPRHTMWADVKDTRGLQPGDTWHWRLGRWEFQELTQAAREGRTAPRFYLMHNFITDEPPLKSSILTGRTEAEHLQDREAARANLASFDQELGAFLDVLREAGSYDASLIVITADTAIDHALFETRGERELPFSDEMARVFFAIKRPGQRMGRLIRAPIRQIDVLPTVLADLGIDPAPYQFEGEPVTDPRDTTPLAQRPLEFVVATRTAGLVHYQLTDPVGPLRRRGR